MGFHDPVDIDGAIGTSRARITHFFAMRAVTLMAFHPGSDGSTMRNLHLQPRPFNDAFWIEGHTSGVTITGSLFDGAVSILDH